jgi:hypothetical protein
MTQRNEMAAVIWPHLARHRPAPRETPGSTSPLAAAMYPNHAPKPPQPYNWHREATLRNLRELNAKHRKG